MNNEITQSHLSGAIAKELDFYRIRDSIASLAVSEEGKAALLLREPSDNREHIEYLKKLGREWNIYLHSPLPQAVTAWPECRPYFKILGTPGAQLEQDQLFALGIFCQVQKKASECLESAKESLPIPVLSELAGQMPSLDGASREIFSILTKEGEVKDLPALREIRTKIAALHKEIDNSIRKYTSDSAMSAKLQSNVPAFRAERQLIAVKAEYRNSISGIIHEVSASGQTVFIEPDEAVKANNELIQQEYQLQAELRKIFQEVTEKLGAYKKDFSKAQELLVLFDSTYAAARWQSQINGIFAQEADRSKEPPVIHGARHPLLGSRAVPVDIQFMDGKNILIITGPNTGGKTVTLKTIALFALLNQAGFPIPAEEGTRLPVFGSVFADIGDEQSIDESLSTFSSHMKKLAQMMNFADENSLVLLDELASGTDPQEGGAIAMAALDTLIERKSFVVVTTHHGILKNYGYTTSSCINASVEFDANTLRPTYRLLMGVPGESHALDIALRSGLPENIIQQARDYISSEKADVSTLIKGLTAKHAELDELQKQERIKNAELSQKAVKLHSRELAVKEKEIELREEENRKSSEFLSQTRKKLENLVRELREGEITKEKTHSVKDFIANLTEEIAQREKEVENQKILLEQEKIEAQKEEEQFAENGMRLSKAGGHNASTKKKCKKRLSNADAFAKAEAVHFETENKNNSKKTPAVKKQIVLEPGMQILAGANKRKGMLVSENKNGTWTVLFGSLKMSVPKNQIVPMDIQSAIQTTEMPEISNTGSLIINDEKPKFELRLLGMRYEEAMKALEHQIDLCAIHNFKNFSIIHGKGTGILQQAVHDYLSHYPGILDFRFAQPEDGGTGKTYVTMQ